jgi:hypothetical protein
VDITTTNNTKNLFKAEAKMTIEEKIKTLRDKFLDEEYGSCVYNIGRKGLADFVLLVANNVVEEIEKVFTADYPSIFMATQAMRDKINELKGKE